MVVYFVGFLVLLSLFWCGFEIICFCIRLDEIGCVVLWNVFFDGDDLVEFLKYLFYWWDVELFFGEFEEILCVNLLIWLVDG